MSLTTAALALAGSSIMSEMSSIACSQKGFVEECPGLPRSERWREPCLDLRCQLLVNARCIDSLHFLHLPGVSESSNCEALAKRNCLKGEICSRAARGVRGTQHVPDTMQQTMFETRTVHTERVGSTWSRATSHKFPTT